MTALSAGANWLRHLSAREVLAQVVPALQNDGVDVLIVKGAITAYTLYADISSRTISDVDLRVARRDYRKLVAIARARGWKQKGDTPLFWNAIFEVDGVQVDVECTLGPPGLCSLSVEDLIARAQWSTEPFGFPHRQPELHDHALLMVLNAFKDGLRPMPWSLEDLRRIAGHDQFRPDALIARARQGRVASALWVVADWLADSEGAVEWEPVRRQLGERPASPWIARLYGHLRAQGWPPKAGLLVVAAGNDRLAQRASGVAMAIAGVARRRLLHAVQRL